MRFSFSEVTLPRIHSAIRRRLQAVPDVLAWQRSSEALANRERLEALRDRHRGERCFVLGNGPSLARTDLAPLRGAQSIGSNRLYLHFEAMGFATRYHVCINELVLEQFGAELAALSMPRFYAWNRRALFAPAPGLHFVHTALSLRDFFGTDPTRALCSGGTVSFVALELAFYMGFQEVILLGLDHNFAQRGTPNQVALRTDARDADHFHPQYFPRGSRWQFPDLVRSEAALALARRHYERAGRRILDATPGGRCPAFERVEYAAVL
jgi:hypothetical protein